METLKFVIVGHVDHGKSTLIGRLLYDTNSLPEGKLDELKAVCDGLGRPLEFGFVMDGLEEERNQGVTIDTTQIWFRTKQREYNIIDAPGHVEFIKNMVTGASQAEAAILIVDAKEGVQEQTRRHAYVLGMLGLKQVIVVINKMDLVGFSRERYEKVAFELNSFLARLHITPNYVIPISAMEGDNIVNPSGSMLWYTGPTVLKALASFKPHPSNDKKPLRFSVQDVYRHDKRIVVGMVNSGILRKGQQVVVMPSGETTVIESIEEFLKENIEMAPTGSATGIVTKDKLFIERGDVLCGPENLPKITDEFKAHIFWMSKEPLKNKERIILKLSTQQAIAEVELMKVIDSSTLEEMGSAIELKNRQVAYVVIRPDKPMVVESFNNIEELGRFVLERMNTCAGGIITK